MNHRSTTSVLLSAFFALAIVGCSAPAPDSTASPTPTASTPPTAAPTTPSPDPSAAAATCESVLDTASIDTFTSHGYTLSDDFVDRGRDQGWPIMAFVNYGGILCQWGVTNSDQSEYYGLSEITPEQAAQETARLGAEGFTAEAHPAGELFVGPPSETFQEHYLFADDHWFVAYSTARIDEIRRNAGLG